MPIDPKTTQRSWKEKRLGEMFDQIDEARRASIRALREFEAAEARVDNLLADARILMLTD